MTIPDLTVVVNPDPNEMFRVTLCLPNGWPLIAVADECGEIEHFDPEELGELIADGIRMAQALHDDTTPIYGGES